MRQWSSSKTPTIISLKGWLRATERSSNCWWEVRSPANQRTELVGADTGFARGVVLAGGPVGARLAADLSLRLTQQAFSLSKGDFDSQYFERFESICEEIKAAKPLGAVEQPKLRSRKRKE